MVTDNELVFEDPSARQGGPGRPRIWGARAEALKAHPGRWVNATATWGCRASNGAARRSGLQVRIRSKVMYVRWPEDVSGEVGEEE